MKESSNVKKHIKAYTRYIEELRFQLFKKNLKLFISVTDITEIKKV